MGPREIRDRCLKEKLNLGIINKAFVNYFKDEVGSMYISLIVQVYLLPLKLRLIRLHWLIQSQKAEALKLFMRLPPNFSEAFKTSLKSTLIIQGLLELTIEVSAKY